MPYAGAAGISALAFIAAYLVLPETRGRPLFDTMEEMHAADEAERRAKQQQ